PLIASTDPSKLVAVRGPVLSFRGDPFRDGLADTMVHEPDAIVVMRDGRIVRWGPASQLASELPSGVEIRDWGRSALICAGFTDCPVHFPPTPMMAAYGARLLDWLITYTFPTELKFADPTFAAAVARIFLKECLRNGITTSCVYCTVHPHSVDV